MKLPRAIKSAREDADLSQAELAELVGVSPSTVAGWELGSHGVRLSRLAAIAKATGKTIAELVG